MIPRTLVYTARNRPAFGLGYHIKSSVSHSGSPKAPLARSFRTNVPLSASSSLGSSRRGNPKFHPGPTRPTSNSSSSGSNPPPSRNTAPVSFSWTSYETLVKLGSVAIVGGTVYYIYHLERAPVTGRWRFMDISPEREALLASQTYQKLLSELEGKILPMDHVLTRHVRKVVNRILEGSQLGRLDDEHVPPGEESIFGGTPGDAWSDGFSADGQNQEYSGNASLPRHWKLLVVDAPDINAGVVNGTIIVFTGMLAVCRDENGLAAVLGHEIAHVVARHSAERMSSSKIFTILSFLGDLFLDIDYGFSKFLITYILELPNSRDQELEADRIGLTLTSQACYDPQSVVDLQKRFVILESKQKRRVDFLHTHPAAERRAKILESYLPDAYSAQAASSLCAAIQSNLGAFNAGIATYVSSREE